MTASLSLDAGALIAAERGDVRVFDRLDQASRSGLEVHVVAGVIAQTWRGGMRPARLARLLNAEEVHTQALDEAAARAVGELCGRSGHHDVVDVHVVLHARQHNHRLVTSDPDDLLAVDPHLQLIVI